MQKNCVDLPSHTGHRPAPRVLRTIIITPKSDKETHYACNFKRKASLSKSIIFSFSLNLSFLFQSIATQSTHHGKTDWNFWMCENSLQLSLQMCQLSKPGSLIVAVICCISYQPILALSFWNVEFFLTRWNCYDRWRPYLVLEYSTSHTIFRGTTSISNSSLGFGQRLSTSPITFRQEKKGKRCISSKKDVYPLFLWIPFDIDSIYILTLFPMGSGYPLFPMGGHMAPPV